MVVDMPNDAVIEIDDHYGDVQLIVQKIQTLGYVKLIHDAFHHFTSQGKRFFMDVKVHPVQPEMRTNLVDNRMMFLDRNGMKVRPGAKRLIWGAGSLRHLSR